MGSIRKYPWREFGPRMGDWLRSEFEREELMQTCLSCHHFDNVSKHPETGEALELCKRYGKRPPAKIIANGCRDHEDAYEVPF